MEMKYVRVSGNPNDPLLKRLIRQDFSSVTYTRVTFSIAITIRGL